MSEKIITQTPALESTLKEVEKRPAPMAANKAKTIDPEPNVVKLTSGNPSFDKTKIRPQKIRRYWLALSFIFLVLAPIGLGVYYYIYVASDRYVSGAGFSVRGVNSGGSLDGIGALTGLASAGSTTSDSYIVLEYLKGRNIVERLLSEMDLRTAYNHSSIDPISKMKDNIEIEDFVLYWEGKIETSFNSTSGIVTFDVQAFNAEDAYKIANLVLKYTQDLVNKLSADARQDSVRFATIEVKNAEERLHQELKSIRDFRERESSINPEASAQLDIELITTIKGKLIDISARIAALKNSVADNAPSMVDLRRQAAALEEQISERTLRIGLGSSDSNFDISSLLATYETLVLEKEFAQKSYASALSSMEKARVEADRQQKYLAVYRLPDLPQSAIYPQRYINILMLIVLILCLWGIATLIAYSIRDHLS